jgi:hypothetical protein
MRFTITKLERYIHCCKNRVALCRAIVFTLTTHIHQRYNEEWIYFKNKSLLPLQQMHNLSLIKSLNRIKSAKDLYVIDISILRNKKRRDKLFKENKWLKESILDEIEIVVKSD